MQPPLALVGCESVVYWGSKEGLGGGFKEGPEYEARQHDTREELRHGMACTFLRKLDALDAATREELSEIATALHRTLVWSQDEEAKGAEAPPAGTGGAS